MCLGRLAFTELISKCSWHSPPCAGRRHLRRPGPARPAAAMAERSYLHRPCCPKAKQPARHRCRTMKTWARRRAHGPAASAAACARAHRRAWAAAHAAGAWARLGGASLHSAVAAAPGRLFRLRAARAVQVRRAAVAAAGRAGPKRRRCRLLAVGSLQALAGCAGDLEANWEPLARRQDGRGGGAAAQGAAEAQRAAGARGRSALCCGGRRHRNQGCAGAAAAYTRGARSAGK
jgi:hypothetical protein